MSYPCAEHGCSALTIGTWLYCDDHRTEDKEKQAADEWGRGMIDDARQEVARILRFLDDDGPNIPGLRQTVLRQTEQIDRLEDEIFNGTIEAVTPFAIMVGSTHALIDSILQQRGLRSKIDAMKPDADIGGLVRGGGRKGAAIRRARPGMSDEKIDAAMRLIHATDPSMLWTPASEQVAAAYSTRHPEHKISGKTIRRRTKVKW